MSTYKQAIIQERYCIRKAIRIEKQEPFEQEIIYGAKGGMHSFDPNNRNIQYVGQFEADHHREQRFYYVQPPNSKSDLINITAEEFQRRRAREPQGEEIAEIQAASLQNSTMKETIERLYTLSEKNKELTERGLLYLNQTVMNLVLDDFSTHHYSGSQTGSQTAPLAPTHLSRVYRIGKDPTSGDLIVRIDINAATMIEIPNNDPIIQEDALKFSIIANLTQNYTDINYTWSIPPQPET